MRFRDDNSVSLRRFPKPFRAMLAISTDIDHTTITNFRETHRFMNTKAPTSMGPGLGLDVGNSMWLYKKMSKPADKFSINSQIAYFTGTDSSYRSPVADELIAYAKAGWIDTLHSYGDFSQARNGSFTRKHAEDACRVLDDHAVRLPVWVNHGNSNNIQNIGTADYMQGDVARSAAYHADLMTAAGITFIGTEHISEFGEAEPIRPLKLADRRKLWAFRRFAHYVNLPGSETLGVRYGVPSSQKKGKHHLWVWHPRALHLQLSSQMLDQAASEGRFVITAQHLGSGGPLNRFGEKAALALRQLAERQDRGDILVTRSSRLLEYYRVTSQLNYKVVADSDALSIDIRSIDDHLFGSIVPSIDQLRGVTFELRRGRPAQIMIAGSPIAEELIERTSSADGTSTLAVRWHEADYTDYTEPFRNRPDAISLTPKIDGQVADQALLARRLENVLPNSLSASYAGRLAKALAHSSDIGFAGRSGIRAVTMGSADDLEPVAVSLLNEGKSAIDCVEPSMVKRNECQQAASALGVGQAISFHDDMTPLLAAPSDGYHAMWFGDLVQTADPEIVFGAVGRQLLHKNHVYLRYPGKGHYLRKAAQCIEHSPEEAEDVIKDLFAAVCYQAGLGQHGQGLWILDQDALFETTRLLGLRYIEAPGFLDGRASFAGCAGDFDVVLERNANDKKKYFVPDTEEALTAEKNKDDRWLARVQHLVEIGLSRLAARVLDASELGKRYQSKGASIKALALAKSGQPVPGDVMSAIDPSAIHARSLALMANADYEEALELLNQAETSDLSFLQAVAYLESGQLERASEIFRKAYENEGCSLSLVGLLHSFFKIGRIDECVSLLRKLDGLKDDVQPDVTSEAAATITPASMTSHPKPDGGNLRRPGQPHVISVVGISFCGSSVLNLVLSSHPEIHGGGELHKLFIPEKNPRCSVCQYDCDHWTADTLAKIERPGLYQQMSTLFGTEVIADTSKTINHFEATHPLNPDVSYDYTLLIKHPIRHVASYVNNKFVVNRGLAASLRKAIRLGRDERDIVDYVDKRFARLIRDYKDIMSRLEALSDGRGYTVRKYEDFVRQPRLFLEPILARAGLDYDEGMLDYVSKSHHPIGGNRGPHYQINKKLSTSRFVGYRKSYYEDNDGLAIDDKYLNTFSSSQLEAIRRMDSYQRVCDFLGYDTDAR